MKQASFLHPWSSIIEDYFRYEIEEVENGVRSRTNPVNIQEEVANLTDFEPAEIFSKISCPVLILRATDGILGQDDVVLPETSESAISAAKNSEEVVRHVVHGAEHGLGFYTNRPEIAEDVVSTTAEFLAQRL